MKFNYNLQLYIPSQNNDNQYINVYATLKNMGVSAFTLTKAMGSWNQYTEEINIVEIFLEFSKDVEKIVNDFFYQLMSTDLSYKQEAVSFKVNGIPYIVSNEDNLNKFNQFFKGEL